MMSWAKLSRKVWQDYTIYIAKLASQAPLIVFPFFLKSLSLEHVGTYALWGGYLSILMAVCSFEAIQVMLSRSGRFRRMFRELLFGRIAWVLALFLATFFMWTDEVVLTSVLTLVVIPFELQICIELMFLRQRVLGSNQRYQRTVLWKLLLADCLLPSLILVALYLEFVRIALSTQITILVWINLQILWILTRRGRSFSVAFPSISLLNLSFLKRTESQSLRILFGWTFGAAALGGIYPAFIVGRVFGLIGNFWYLLNFHSKRLVDITNRRLFSFPVSLFALIVGPMISASVGAFIFDYFFNWTVPFYAFYLVIVLNVLAVYKLLLRARAFHDNKIAIYLGLIVVLILWKALVFWISAGAGTTTALLVVSIGEFIALMSIAFTLMRRSQELDST